MPSEWYLGLSVTKTHRGKGEAYDMLCVVASATKVANRGSVDASAAKGHGRCRAKTVRDAPANMESMLKSWPVAPRPALLLMALESASANYRHSERQAAKYSKKSTTKQLQTQSCPYLKCHLSPTLLVLKSRKREVAKVAAQGGIAEPVAAARHAFVRRHCCRRLSITHFVAVRSQRNNSV